MLRHAPMRFNWFALFAVSVFLFGIVSPYLLAPIGVNFADEPYQIIVARYFKDAPITFMSGFLGHVWGQLFGWKLLTMRYYAISIQLIGLLCGGVYLYKRLHNAEMAVLIIGICAFFMNGMSNIGLIGWDATSNCMLSLTALALIQYMSKPCFKRMVVLCVCTSVAIFTRLPNIVCIIAAVLIILVFSKNDSGRKERLLRSLTYCCVTVFCSMCIICAFYGSLTGYIQAIVENAISDHSAARLIKYYYYGALEILPHFGLIWSMYLLVQVTCKYVNNRRVRGFFLVAISLVFFQYARIKYLGNHCVMIQQVCYAYFLLLVVYSIVAQKGLNKKKEQNQHASLMIPCILLLFSLVSVVGSNAGSDKFNSVILLPILLAVSFGRFNIIIKRFTLVVALPLGLSIVWCRMESSFKDVGFKAASPITNVSKLEGIMTEHGKGQDLEILNKVIEENKGRDLIFASAGLNYNRFMGYYLNDSQPQFHQHTWDNNSCEMPDFINKTTEYLQIRKIPTSVIVLEVEGSETDFDRAMYRLRPSKIENIQWLRVYHFD